MTLVDFIIIILLILIGLRQEIIAMGANVERESTHRNQHYLNKTLIRYYKKIIKEIKEK